MFVILHSVMNQLAKHVLENIFFSNILHNILTTSHFLPSLANTGGLLEGGALTGEAAGAPTLGGALNGAGPERRLEFLCVCMSVVTFFKPACNNNYYTHVIINTE